MHRVQRKRRRYLLTPVKPAPDGGARMRPMDASPLSPGGGFDEPFALLAACHDRIRRSLDLLQRLLAHVQASGTVDAQAQSAAHDVLRYFTLAAPAHHEDEERHLVPLLRASADAATRAVAERLLHDHDAIRAAWRVLEPPLRAIEAGTLPAPAAWRDASTRFVELHAGHLELEDEFVFPRAQAALAARGDDTLRAMGDEMARRRGASRG